MPNIGWKKIFSSNNLLTYELTFIKKLNFIFRNRAYAKLVMENLMWRNTKESIKNECEIPPLVEDLVLLDFTPIEALLYKDCQNNLASGYSLFLSLLYISMYLLL